MKKLLAILLVGTMGCASAPKTFQFEPVAAIDANYDQVWGAVVEFFAISNLPITTIEKDSGLIVTTWLNAGATFGENKDFCDCGGKGISDANWTRGKFSILVSRVTDSKTNLRVTCTYQQGRSVLGSASGVASCNSKGFLEAHVHDYVRSKLAGQPTEPMQFKVAAVE